MNSNQLTRFTDDTTCDDGISLITEVSLLWSLCVVNTQSCGSGYTSVCVRRCLAVFTSCG